MSEWKTVGVSEVLEFREGPGILAKDFRETGVPLLRLAGLKRGAALRDGCNYLDADMVEARWRQFRLRKGDVLLSTSASLGEVAVVDDSGVGAVPYTGIIGFRPSSRDISPRFIPHALTAPGFKQQIVEMGVGSVMKHFGPSHLRTMTLALPPLADQEAIADVLGALDDKIAANDKACVLMRRLAKAEYDVLLSGSAASGLLGDVLTLEYGKALPASQRMAGGVPVYGSGGEVGRHSRALVGRPGVVVGRKGTAGAVHWVGRPHFAIDTTFYVRPAHSDVPLTFCYFTLQRLGLKEMNSDSAVPGLNRNEAHAQPIRLPDAESRQSFDAAVLPLFECADQLGEENGRVAALRDALLPQLMSGKIRVKDAEHAVSEVV